MIVIADDITGAAEIAGIAFSKGHQVSLVCGEGVATNQITVIATDTRSMTEAEAIAETKQLSLLISHHSSLIYKKTDSALRGHVVAELEALMQATGYKRAVYLPANPSKGRIVRNGIYYIGETPIAETAFSYDPEFPAKTSALRERFPDAEEKGIIMPDAESEEDIRRIITEYNDGHTLFAGAADLFSAFLTSKPTTYHPPINTNNKLILCGSTQSKPLELGIPIAPMPKEIYDGSDDLSLWDTSKYDQERGLILTIPYTHRTGKEVAVHLRNIMAKMTQQLIKRHHPKQLIVEGGATAGR